MNKQLADHVADSIPQSPLIYKLPGNKPPVNLHTMSDQQQRQSSLVPLQIPVPFLLG